jgi:hypothetical protein
MLRLERLIADPDDVQSADLERDRGSLRNEFAAERLGAAPRAVSRWPPPMLMPVRAKIPAENVEPLLTP